jgi:hypothetical protein
MLYTAHQFSYRWKSVDAICAMIIRTLIIHTQTRVIVQSLLIFELHNVRVHNMDIIQSIINSSYAKYNYYDLEKLISILPNDLHQQSRLLKFVHAG